MFTVGCSVAGADRFNSVAPTTCQIAISGTSLPTDLEGNRLVSEGLVLGLDHQNFVLAVGYGPRAYLRAVYPSSDFSAFQGRGDALGDAAHENLWRHRLGQGNLRKRHDRDYYGDGAPDFCGTHNAT